MGRRSAQGAKKLLRVPHTSLPLACVGNAVRLKLQVLAPEFCYPDQSGDPNFAPA